MRPGRSLRHPRCSIVAKFLICMCASLDVVINLLTYLHVGKSSKGAGNETWSCCVEFELDLGQRT